MPSYEKNRSVRYGFLSIDAHDGEEYIAFAKKLNSETVAEYIHSLAGDAQQAGYTTLTVIIDNNSMHKDKMRYELWLRMHQGHEFDRFRVRFIDTPRYSPEMNPAEYIIHQLRRRLLHHISSRPKIDELCQKIKTSLQNTSFRQKNRYARQSIISSNWQMSIVSSNLWKGDARVGRRRGVDQQVCSCVRVLCTAVVVNDSLPWLDARTSTRA